MIPPQNKLNEEEIGRIILDSAFKVRGITRLTNGLQGKAVFTHLPAAKLDFKNPSQPSLPSRSSRGI